jgi:hypothetical protein
MVTEGEGRRPVTEGDVRAHFQAFEGGGAVVFRKVGPPAAVSAAPANLLEHGIRPFPGPDSPWDGAHFCETDWHLLVAALTIGSADGEPDITRQGPSLSERRTNSSSMGWCSPTPRGPL